MNTKLVSFGTVATIHSWQSPSTTFLPLAAATAAAFASQTCSSIAASAAMPSTTKTNRRPMTDLKDLIKAHKAAFEALDAFDSAFGRKFQMRGLEVCDEFIAAYDALDRVMIRAKQLNNEQESN